MSSTTLTLDNIRAVMRAENERLKHFENALIAEQEENERLRAELAEAMRLLVLARAEVEFWTPDESNAGDDIRALNGWFDLRDRIDAAMAGGA